MQNSIPAIALEKTEAQGMALYSYATLAELSQVLLRPKFSRYITCPTTIARIAAKQRAR